MTRRIDSPDTQADLDIRVCLDAKPRTSFIMVAGAGSGKTTSLIKALDHIGKKYGLELKRSGQKVACITYTETAVGEIWGDVGNNPLFHVSTIHSFLWEVAKPFQKEIRVWLRQNTEEELRELEQERANFTKRVRQTTRDKNAANTERCNELLTSIDSIKRFTYGTGSKHIEGILGHTDIIKMVSYLIMKYPLLPAIIANKYPIFFLDESQDTFSEVVDSLRHIEQQQKGRFCLGFFGDPMQQIYMTGIGPIPPEPTWHLIAKEENFRSPQSVLSTINRIRHPSDELVQRGGRKGVDGQPITGSSKLFILPLDQNKQQNMQRVCEWMARIQNDPLWAETSDAISVKILVIVHRMAATRLGFDTLYSALNDKAPSALKDGFADGTTWALKPFIDVIIPLVEVMSDNRNYEVMTLLRRYSPQLAPDYLSAHPHGVREILARLKTACEELERLMNTGTTLVGDVLQYVSDQKIMMLDERFTAHLSGDWRGQLPSTAAATDDNAEKNSDAMRRYLQCPASQLFGYYKYINENSAYSTQHDVKGAEFERVLVILDDEEGKYFLYSYEKLFGLRPLSETDQTNEAEGSDWVNPRTRRLFYVCCSRARKDLAVVLYTESPDQAAEQLRANSPFISTDILTLENLN